MAELPLIDQQSIENLRALNPGDNDVFLREIIAIYLEDMPLRIADLEQSLAAGDVAKFNRAAHSVKGSSSNLGAMTVRAVAEKLENESGKHGLANVAPLVADLKTEFAHVHAEFTKLAQPL